MIRKIAPFCICISLFATGNALAKGGGFSYAIFGSLQYANINESTGSTDIDRTSQFGFGGGVGIEVALGKKFGLSLDVIVALRRYYEVVSGSRTNFTTPFVEIPLLFKLYMVSGIFSVGLGPYYGKGVAIIFRSPGANISYDEPDGISSDDFGIATHLGINFNMAKTTQFFIDGRYNFGLADLALSDATVARWGNIQVNVGLRFGASKRK